MPFRDPHDMTEDELRKSFLIKATDFFTWNSGKNTPNILLGLSERIEILQSRAKEAADRLDSLQKTVQEASDSSSKLSRALNRFTLALVIVGTIGLVLQAAYVVFTALAYLHK
jgi:Flp pilus assembly protein TadB